MRQLLQFRKEEKELFINKYAQAFLNSRSVDIQKGYIKVGQIKEYLEQEFPLNLFPKFQKFQQELLDAQEKVAVKLEEPVKMEEDTSAAGLSDSSTFSIGKLPPLKVFSVDSLLSFDDFNSSPVSMDEETVSSHVSLSMFGSSSSSSKRATVDSLLSFDDSSDLVSIKEEPLDGFSSSHVRLSMFGSSSSSRSQISFSPFSPLSLLDRISSSSADHVSMTDTGTSAQAYSESSEMMLRKK